MTQLQPRPIRGRRVGAISGVDRARLFLVAVRCGGPPHCRRAGRVPTRTPLAAWGPHAMNGAERTSTSAAEAEELLSRIEEKRGYVLDFHRVLAHADPAFLTAFDALISASYTDQRLLSQRDKELAYIAMLVALGADRQQISTHMSAADRAGASDREVLEILELCLPECGAPKFMRGVDVWREVFDVKGTP